jgi:hypothetical protein
MQFRQIARISAGVYCRVVEGNSSKTKGALQPMRAVQILQRMRRRIEPTTRRRF